MFASKNFKELPPENHWGNGTPDNTDRVSVPNDKALRGWSFGKTTPQHPHQRMSPSRLVHPIIECLKCLFCRLWCRKTTPFIETMLQIKLCCFVVSFCLKKPIKRTVWHRFTSTTTVSWVPLKMAIKKLPQENSQNAPGETRFFPFLRYNGNVNGRERGLPL